MQLDIKHLLAFDAIYATRNLSKAAKLLGLAQPTVSNLLGRMREVLDDPLFVRRPGGMAPTTRADELIGGVQRILEECELMGEPSASFDPVTATRDFRLHLVDIFETLLIPELVSQSERFPGISYKLLLAPKLPIGEALESGEADLAVGMAPPNNQLLRWEAIMPIELTAIARRGHPEIDGQITAEQFRKMGHVSLDLESGALANAATFRPSHRIERRDVVRVTRPGSVLEIVARSNLVGLVHPIQLMTSPHRHFLQRLDVPLPTFSQQFQMTWHQRNTEDPGLVWLKGRIRNILRQRLHAATPE
ncbi:LysR family transcriptional regulator [Roseinatronobacter sp. S2]|uniref:LysR family transcriptional regulator n=1 Tax=Roseinatronobacter sp. S2 TaxID=3035471 RepID=UPI00240F4956|nr:LysR family transcriptional regulator [Roseinatronobacter sp. S2]WFE76633.1 LysR family transcriptional regulator [Roseinatronobacter sp. S2]